MIIYDGTYRLRSVADQAFSSDRSGEQAWWVRIIDFSIDRPGLLFLKSFAVFATPSAPGDSGITCAQGVGAGLLRDFRLVPQHVLWVEYFKKDPGHLHVAEFRSQRQADPAVFEKIHWRPIRPNELELIQGFIPEAEFIDIGPIG